MKKISEKRNIQMALAVYLETLIVSGGVPFFLLHMSIQKTISIMALSLVLCTAFIVAYAADVINVKEYHPISPVEISIVYGIGLVLGIFMVYEPDYCDTVLVLPVMMGVVCGIVPAIAAHAVILSTVFLWGGMHIEILLFYLIAGIVAAYFSSCLTKKRQVMSGLITMFSIYVLTMCVYVFFSTERFKINILFDILIGAGINILAVIVVFPYLYRSRNKENYTLNKIIKPEYAIISAMIKTKRRVYNHAADSASLAAAAAAMLGADSLLTKCSIYYYNYARTLGKNYVDPFIETAYWKKLPKRMVDVVLSLAAESEKPLTREASIVLVTETLVLAKESGYAGETAEDVYLNAIIRQKVNRGLLDKSELSMRDYALLRDFLIVRLCDKVKEKE